MAPTYEHEAWRELLRRAEPALLERLLEVAGVRPPALGNVREASGDASQLIPVQFTADLVLLCGEPTSHVVVVEVQRRPDAQKRASWPAYVAGLHAMHTCPVTLLVICPTRRVAMWARRKIVFGTGAQLSPTVVGPDELPLGRWPGAGSELDFLLAVLGAAMHAGEPAALEQAKLLGAEVLGSRPIHDEICYRLLEKLFGTEFSIHMEDLMGAPAWYDDSPVYLKMQAAGREKGKAEGVALGKAEGKAEGKASALLAVLGARGLAPSAAQCAQVQSCQDHESLDTWLLRALKATSADEVFGG